MTTTRNAPCPCGSGAKYKRCCGPVHGGAPAPTAVALVRARYTAHVDGNGRFIVTTVHADSPHRRDDERVWLHDLDAAHHATTYLGLSIIDEKTSGDEAWVTYVVVSTRDEVRHERTERGYFKRNDGRWYFVYGLRAV